MPAWKKYFWILPAVLLVVVLALLAVLLLRPKAEPTDPDTVVIEGIEDPNPDLSALRPAPGRVDFEHQAVDGTEYALIRAYAADGSLLWERETGHYEATELSPVEEIGMDSRYYYYVEGGVVTALDLASGETRWINGDFGGYSIHSLLEDGKIYLCGFYGPDFFAVDTDGRTLVRLGQLDEQFYWPYALEKINENTVAVRFSGGLTPGVEEDSFPIYVDTRDYSVRYTRISQEEALEIASAYWDFQEGDVAEDTGYPLGVLPCWTETASNGRLCYVMQFQWLVDNDHWSTLDRIFVDADTGEIYSYYD
jgi:outer membrane protein assembly factor BamB